MESQAGKGTRLVVEVTALDRSASPIANDSESLTDA